ncbi:FKBP-type peptidyl-prolyl cis-trans isomerase [Marinospirillum alkaliphilum]|uniref:Peptidyl-prolyl cis-trans isomerase n=1 Tax=Marinospirillum alkaliphilum DSM 21637 TaxID=1122209 RepID=A0A1K1Y5M1_9GAMM|nr:FKBP-type peptidyl-prolyl cis-trans isomerase [Marinospirillum alkaliphilum]SFX57030.1 FKBP-type peptidyl-prolyl cis-trans isomerase FklB [Marinospirillum alkaliphilum DSM 21637]
MYKQLGLLATAATLSLALALPATALANPSTDKERIGYSLGIMVGRQLQQDVKDLDIDSFSAALKDLYAGREPKLDDQQIGQVLEQLQQQLMAEAQQQAEREAAENLQRGQQFLAENAGKAGVQVTASGLQYKVVREGKGNKPKAGSTVKVHYEGTLTDGTVFDSSYRRGEPVSFRVNQVIAGWQEALQLMPEGSEWMLYIPAELAYGPAGAGGAIGPNETLVFKVELQEVKD